MKHVMLTFLSTARKNNDAYYRDIEREEMPTKTTNESAIRWLIKHEFNGDAAQLSRIFIFASKAVREPMQDDPRTHLQYFMETIKDYINAAECIPDDAVYPFDEDGSGDRNLISVAEMAARIQKYAAECGDKITLHVDVSGGMRHISMIMLDVIRLLEYSGITIKHILYSNFKFGRKDNYVEPVKNIYDLFQLISGVEEFVQFGSVKALDEYYRNKSGLSEGLTRLIDAIRNFSEQVKLCHYGLLELAIRQLHDAVHDFKPDENNAQDLLMARLIDRIKEMYADTIKNRTVDDIELIRWCIDNDHMQQALTLYTERVPEYLGDHGCIEQTPEEAAKLTKHVRGDDMGRNRWFYLLNEYQSLSEYSFCSDDKERTRGLKIYCNVLKNDAMIDIRKKKFDYDAWWSKLNEQFKTLNLILEDEPRLRTQLELLVKLRTDPTPLLTLAGSALDPIRRIINALTPELETIPEDHKRFKRLQDFISKDIPNDAIPKYFPGIANPYPHAVAIQKLISAGIFSVTIDKDKFLNIMNRYFRLKRERNHSNHARSDLGEFTTAVELKHFIADGLKDIREVVMQNE